MKETKFKPTLAQEKVVNLSGTNMLVSASAGTGKTTTMIRRIVNALCRDVDVSEIVVVTFTNLAAAEMKARLAEELSRLHTQRAAEQLEKLDTAAICTLHSFCVELLRNYFYVVDLDPSFTVLDGITSAALRKNALDDLFAEYFAKDDATFREVYKIFSTHRREDNFRDTLMRLYDFACCLDNFSEWYASKRQNFVQPQQNGVLASLLLDDIRQMLNYHATNLEKLANRAADLQLDYADVIASNAVLLRALEQKELQETLDGLFALKLYPIPAKKRGETLSEYEQSVKSHCRQLKKELDERIKKYGELYRGERLEVLWREMELSVAHTDKLAELVVRFGELFAEQKRQRGGVDFNDLEHFTLQLLRDEPTLSDIHARYKSVFVDEYQDTNPVQEEIVSRLAQANNLFMVGDVKQSIYGFRGCDPDIFVSKRQRYLNDHSGEVVELNDNFRSNVQILDFVNNIFSVLMTEQFGHVDYANTAMLHGSVQPTLQTPSVRVDFIKKAETEKQEITEVYDITAPEKQYDAIKQGELIANRINEYVGKAYFVKDSQGKRVEKRIGYGDVVILMRGMTARAVDIYNTLNERNIPVAASFKVENYANKEVRDIVNLLRVLDNPYNDVYMVGACLVFGELTESQLVPIRLDTEGRIPFYERLLEYAQKGKDKEIVQKVRDFLRFLSELRFYSHSVSVDETILKVLERKDYALAVQSLTDGELRLNKLYSFIDSLKGANYAQSVDKFLSYVDETEEKDSDVQNAPNAVRMMTMHASKGLEFPVVIVAGLESNFKFDRYALKTDTELGVALNYYNFDTMRFAQTVGSFVCETANERKQREEEMRLLYVAMTRAKYVLDLVATVDGDQLSQLPKQPTRANSHLDWLLNGLQANYNGVEGLSELGVEINVAESVNRLDPQKDDNLCDQTVDVDEVLCKISYQYPHKEATKLPSKVVSSALDKEYIDLTEDSQPEQVLSADGDRNEVGTAYHKVYQYVDYDADMEQIRQCIASLVKDGRIDGKFADCLDVKLIFDTLHNPQLRKLVSEGTVYREIPFMLYAYYDQLVDAKQPHEKVMLQGVIDLLVLGKKATVIDFKYTGRSDLVKARYRSQLNSYRMAVERICGISDVECYVLSIADNKLIKM